MRSYVRVCGFVGLSLCLLVGLSRGPLHSNCLLVGWLVGWLVCLFVCFCFCCCCLVVTFSETEFVVASLPITLLIKLSISPH